MWSLSSYAGRLVFFRPQAVGVLRRGRPVLFCFDRLGPILFNNSHACSCGARVEFERVTQIELEAAADRRRDGSFHCWKQSRLNCMVAVVICAPRGGPPRNSAPAPPRNAPWPWRVRTSSILLAHGMKHLSVFTAGCGWPLLSRPQMLRAKLAVSFRRLSSSVPLVRPACTAYGSAWGSVATSDGCEMLRQSAMGGGWP